MIEKTIYVSVRFSEEDAELLKRLLSNDCDMRKDAEAHESALYVRRAFWNALTRAGVK